MSLETLITAFGSGLTAITFASVSLLWRVSHDIALLGTRVNQMHTTIEQLSSDFNNNRESLNNLERRVMLLELAQDKD